jgi:hypothetical protein
MGWPKKILGIGEAVVGAVTGQPALVAGGARTAMSSNGEKQAPGRTFESAPRQINVQPEVPTPANSVEQSRQQTQKRTRGIYNWP